MKTLVNIHNPAIRVTAPEIELVHTEPIDYWRVREVGCYAANAWELKEEVKEEIVMKYIDAEKHYKQVDKLMAHFAELEKEAKPDDDDLSIFYQGKVKMCSELLDIIDALQQEQPEVDLEKEIEKTVSECTNGYNFDWDKFARHFYNLGLKAGKEE